MNRRVTGGRQAKAAGKVFEQWCDEQHAGAQLLGVLARVQHNQPGTKIVGGRVIYTEKSGTDYDGFMVGGKPMASEAKSRVDRLRRSEIEPKQIAELDAVVREGGVAHLLVEFRPGGRFAIPWPDVPWRRLRSAESIGIEDMQPAWAVKEGQCYLARGRQMPPVGVGGRRRVFHRD